MTIDTLVRVLPPPKTPVEAFHGPWPVVEAEIGTKLPQDYKDFVRLYGSGEFLEFFHIKVPWSWYRESRLAAQITVVRNNFANDDDLPYPLWPDAGGLLPFGRSDFGDIFFWLTRGAPEAWPVVFWDRGFGGFEIFDCDLTDFLAGVLTGQIQPKRFPSDALPCDRPFTSTEDGRPL